MRQLVFVCIAVASFLSIITHDAPAQIPEEFTNLQLLDPEINKSDLVATMRDWASGLGVRCAHCHVGPDNLQGMDFASDDKATKRSARQMLKLSRALNKELLADLPTVVEDGRSRAQIVSCYSCHRGMVRPPRHLARELSGAYEAGGAEAVSAHYHQLFEEHAGRGRYDFRNGLAELASEMMESGSSADAIKLILLGLEMDPDSAALHATLGHAQLAVGELDAAEASLNRAIELDPENPTARWGLSRLQAKRDHLTDESGGER